MTAIPQQKTAVVTGAGSPNGIGRRVAAALAGQGWAVALIDVDPQGLGRVEDELKAQGYDALALPLDITDEAAVAQGFERVAAELPPVIGLANLAGIPCTDKVHECERATFDRVMAVNVTGSYLMIRAAAPSISFFWAGDIHIRPSSAMGGRWVKPSVRKRWTRPPS